MKYNRGFVGRSIIGWVPSSNFKFLSIWLFCHNWTVEQWRFYVLDIKDDYIMIEFPNIHSFLSTYLITLFSDRVTLFTFLFIIMNPIHSKVLITDDKIACVFLYFCIIFVVPSFLYFIMKFLFLKFYIVIFFKEIDIKIIHNKALTSLLALFYFGWNIRFWLYTYK